MRKRERKRNLERGFNDGEEEKWENDTHVANI